MPHFVTKNSVCRETFQTTMLNNINAFQPSAVI